MLRQQPSPPSMQSLEAFFAAVKNDSRSYNERPFYLLVGQAGIGKSTALQAYLQEHQYTEAITSVKATPKMTASALFETLLHQLDWPRAHGSITEQSKEAQQALYHTNTALVVIDQAEGLPTKLFDTVLELAHACPLVFVGREQVLLPKLQHPYVSRHQQGRAHLLPFPEADILQQVLPSVNLPPFVFDPKNEQDLALGRALWKLTSPSLRDLQHVIKQAGEVARISQLETVTLECLHAGFTKAVTDASQTTWGELMWVLAAGLLRQEYKAAHDFIDLGVIKVNETVCSHWWWIVQPGDTIWSKFSERTTHTITVDEKLLRQAHALRRRIERMKPGGRPPYL